MNSPGDFVRKKAYLEDNPRIAAIAVDFLRKYGDGRSEALDDLKQLLSAERERGMRDAVADVCGFLRMPDEEFDRTHERETRIAHATADTIERYASTRIAYLVPR